MNIRNELRTPFVANKYEVTCLRCKVIFHFLGILKDKPLEFTIEDCPYCNPEKHDTFSEALNAKI